MPFTLTQVRRIVQDVASLKSSDLRVISASLTEGGSAYVEVAIMVAGCAVDPCLLIIGVDRSRSERALRDMVGERLKEYLEKRRALR